MSAFTYTIKINHLYLKLKKYRRFDDKPFDRQTFRRHGSGVSKTHFGRFADKYV